MSNYTEESKEINIPTIKGYMSLGECQSAINQQAVRINTDISSTLVNTCRITSLRALLRLFEQYNNLLIERETNKGE